MEQLVLFTYAGQSKGIPRHLLDYQPGIFNNAESEQLMQQILADTPWKQPITRLYEKEVITPRLMAWYGDTNDEKLLVRLPDVLPWNNAIKKSRIRLYN